MDGGAQSGDSARDFTHAAPQGLLCLRCARDLGGVPLEGFCPGCGTRIGESAAGGEGGVIDREAPCLVCGYELRGLRSDGQCPECGTPVERSLRGALLRYSAPSYVARLHTGLVWAEIGVAIGLVSSAAFSFLVLGRMGGLAAHGLIQMFQLLMAGVQLVGWWLFTTRDEAAAGSDSSEGARRWARRAIWALAVVEAGLAGVALLPAARLGVPVTTRGGAAGAQILYMIATGVIGGGASALAVIALGTYLRALALRVPSAKLKRGAELYRWLIPLLLALGCVPWFLCCFIPLLPRIAGIVLFYVMVEPWRWELGRIRRELAMDAAEVAYRSPG